MTPRWFLSLQMSRRVKHEPEVSLVAPEEKDVFSERLVDSLAAATRLLFTKTLFIAELGEGRSGEKKRTLLPAQLS